MILGIYHPAEGVGHDTGVALVDERGRILAAHSEERFSRVKMDGGFPFRAVEALRRVVPFGPGDVDTVAVAFMSPGDRAREGGRLLASALREPALAVGQARARWAGDPFQRGMAAIGAYDYLPEHVARVRAVWAADGRPGLAHWPQFIGHVGLGGRPLRQVDHHFAHAAGAYFTSGWDEALVVTLDGIGGLKSGLVAVGRGGRLRITGRTFAPHSAGRFWELVTAICGFHHMKHGGKVTGLAAHGDPFARCYPVMAAALDLGPRSIHTALDPVSMARRLAGVPSADVAATAQRRLEEVVTALVRRAISESGVRRVAVAGGVFANVRLNQRIAALPECAELYVFPAMGDEGLGVGAALAAAARARPLEPAALGHVFLGPEHGEAEIEAALRAGGLPYRKLPEGALAAAVADLLAGGRAVAVFRGRMELGPRALGHRSVLCAAGDAAVNERLNRLLRRSEFMPFAPVTLEEDADRCYSGLRGLRRCAPFMTATVQCTDWMKRVAPAVVHVDGSARPQLVGDRDEPFLAEVLRRYRERTGLPSVINTSFNIHEEPIVESPRDAVRAFGRAGLDALAIGPFLAEGGR